MEQKEICEAAIRIRAHLASSVRVARRAASQPGLFRGAQQPRRKAAFAEDVEVDVVRCVIGIHTKSSATTAECPLGMVSIRHGCSEGGLLMLDVAGTNHRANNCIMPPSFTHASSLTAPQPASHSHPVGPCPLRRRQIHCQYTTLHRLSLICSALSPICLSTSAGFPGRLEQHPGTGTVTLRDRAPPVANTHHHHRSARSRAIVVHHHHTSPCPPYPTRIRRWQRKSTASPLDSLRLPTLRLPSMRPNASQSPSGSR